MRTVLWSGLSLLLLAACGDDSPVNPDAGPRVDADPNAPDADPNAPDADPNAPDAAPPDAAPPPCGTATPPLDLIVGTEGIAIGPDGTLYFSQTGHVGRWRPGEAAPTNQWVPLPGTTTVWGMALAADGTLFVASPATGSQTAGVIWAIDTGATMPAAMELYPMAGRPNGLTLGPDGGVYYGDFAGGQVYRVEPADGTRIQVTTSQVASVNGVLFDADGTLLAAQYQSGDLVRLTLGPDYVETARVPEIAQPGTQPLGNPDGLARDEAGRIYITDNKGDRLLRFTALSAAPEELLVTVDAAATMAFGRGALSCTDLYVASAGPLQRIDVGVTGVP